MNLLIRILHQINLARHISHHLIGTHHTKTHQRIVGVTLMAIGVLIAKSAMHFELFLLHIIGDIIGYGLHGIGLIPYIGGLEKPESAAIAPEENK